MIALERRIQIEDEVILEAMTRAQAAGWNLHGVSDGESITHTGSMAEALEISRSVDESWIYFDKPKEPGKCLVSMFLVRGNDGPDVIADHSVAYGFEDVMDEVYEWASNKFDEEVYGS